jgi:acylphosphatase
LCLGNASGVLEQLHALVTGHVQGVGFRWFTVHAAREAGVQGWVRNLPDGSVELIAQGSQEALQRLLGALRRGPSGSRVRQVVEDWQTAAEPLHGFEIL